MPSRLFLNSDRLDHRLEGGRMMAHAFTHGVWRRRMLATGFVFPLVSSLLSDPNHSANAIDPPNTAVAKAPATSSSNVAEVVKMIDEKLEVGWKENKLTPSRQTDDYEFIRRASLDIIGRIATPAEIVEFEKQPKDARRAWLIDRLLQHEDYAK